MTELQEVITQDQIFMECQLGNPTFTWNNATYPFVPSVTQFSRNLESGGFELVKLLTATVRLLNTNGTKQFTTIPTAQQKLTYNIDGLQYRIENLHIDPSQSYFRIVAEGIAKGI